MFAQFFHNNFNMVNNAMLNPSARPTLSYSFSE